MQQRYATDNGSRSSLTLPTEMGQPHKHMDVRSVLKTQEKLGCYIKIPLTLVGKQPSQMWWNLSLSGTWEVSSENTHTTVGLIVSSCKFSVQHVNT